MPKLSLQKQFEKAVAQIQKKIDAASKALLAAEKLSEEHGIPMRFDCGPFVDLEFYSEQSDKWDDLDNTFKRSLTNMSWNDSGCSWDSSSGCSW